MIAFDVAVFFARPLKPSTPTETMVSLIIVALVAATVITGSWVVTCAPTRTSNSLEDNMTAIVLLQMVTSTITIAVMLALTALVTWSVEKNRPAATVTLDAARPRH